MGQFSNAVNKIQQSIAAASGRVLEDDSLQNARAMTAALAKGSTAYAAKESPGAEASVLSQVMPQASDRRATEESRESLATSIDQMKAAIASPSGATATSEQLVESIERLRNTMDFLVKEERAKRAKLGARKILDKAKEEDEEKKGGGILGKLKYLMAGVVGYALGKWGQGQFAKQEPLRRYDAAIAEAFAKYERHRVRMDVQAAAATGRTTKLAAESRMRAERAWQPIKNEVANLRNDLGKAFDDVLAEVGQVVSGISGLSDDTKPLAGPLPKEFFDAFADVAAGKFGQVERPMPPEPVVPPPRHE